MIKGSKKILSGWSKISECDEERKDDIFLTFDIDWACDEVLDYTINIVEEAGSPATWFVTHETPLLERLRNNKKFELGIHPNFNPLLNGQAGSPEKILDDILNIVPEAKAIRSHSMVQSSRLLDLFKQKGLNYDCNHFIPEQSGIELYPWKVWNGIVKVPHFWEDDAAVIYGDCSNIRKLVFRKGLKAFAFHPIHVFLNTEDLARYERARDSFSNARKLREYRFNGTGTKVYLEELLTFYNYG